MTDLCAVNRLSTADAGFDRALDQLIAWDGVSDADVEKVVRDVIQQVRREGDQALIALINKYMRVCRCVRV